MKKINVLLIGGPIDNNLGGPSIVSSLKQLIPEVLPDAEISVLSFWRSSYQVSENFTELPFSPVTFLKLCLTKKLMPLRKLFSLYKQSDVIIDYWGLMFTDAKKRTLMMRLLEGFPMFLGKIFGKVVIKYTADFGPFYTSVNKKVAKFYLNHVDFVIARSKTSSDSLKKLNIKTPIIICPDTALILKADNALPEEVAPLNLDNLICLSVSHVAERKAGHDNYIKQMAQLCDYLVNSVQTDILIVPNEIAPEKPELDDVRVAHEIAEAVQSKSQVAVFDKTFTAPQLKGIIAKSKIVIASRYHTVVAALSSGVPTVSLSWHEKYRDLMSLFGQQEHVCDLETCDFDTLTSAIMNVWENRSGIRNEINEHIPEVKKSVRYGAEQAKNIILNSIQ